MQFILDLIAAAVIWLAAVAFGHFGIKVELPDRHPPKAERTIERTPATPGTSIGRRSTREAVKTSPDCPELQSASVKRV
jgi:hypothetical protein